MKINEYSQQIREGQKINQQFRKEIRKRDIDHRFSQRRKQLLQQLKNNKNYFNNFDKTYLDLNAIIDQKNQDTLQITRQFQNIYQQYLANHNKINQNQLKMLAIISCTITGAKIILSVQNAFIYYLQNQFIAEEAKDNSQSQKYSLLALSNCLAIADIGSKTQNIAKYSAINASAKSQRFLLKLFTISLHSTLLQSRQHALSCIFNIIYNNDQRFAQQLVLNPTYNLMGLLFNHMHTIPKKQQIIQVFRVFYITMKKLKFPSIDQFGKMRKFIINVIKNSNSKQIIRIAIVCLHAFLKCLPNEKIIISKSGILKQIFTQTLILNNAKIATYSLRIAAILLQQKNQNQTIQIVSFIQKVINQFNHQQPQILALKMLYSILINTQCNCHDLLINHKKLINKIMQLFSSNFTNKDILNQISNILPIIAIKSKNTIDKNLFITIRQRLQQILQTGMFNQINNNFLEQSLSVFGSNNSI